MTLFSKKTVNKGGNPQPEVKHQNTETHYDQMLLI